MEEVFKECYSYVDSLDKDKIKHMGVVYTPLNVVDYINNKVLDIWLEENTNPPQVIDFSCGTGVFLIDMVDKISKRWNITFDEAQNFVHGSDIDLDALSIAKEKLPYCNIFEANGLEVDLSGYDIIVGNPPYVRIQNLSESDRKKIELFEWSSGSYDLYTAFLERAYKANVITSMIFPNSWMNSSADIKMRKWLKNTKIINDIINFKQTKVFKNYGTYCCIVTTNAKENKSFEIANELGQPRQTISYSNMSENLFGYNKQEIEFLNKVQKRNTSFLDLCEIKIGLATLCDNVFFLENCEIKDGFVISEKDGKEIKVEEAVTRICKRPSKIKNLLQNPHERIIFPYVDEDLIDEKTLENKYPLAYAHLLKNKEQLLQRDSGKIKEEEWYAFGRRQGLKNYGEKLLLPNMIKEPVTFFDIGSYYIGYSVFAKDKNGPNIKELEKILLSNDIMKWIAIKGSPKSNGWYSIKKSIFKDYKIDINKEN